MNIKPIVLRVLTPLIAAALSIAACAPFLPGIGNPWSPSSATASTPEMVARGSVPVVTATGQAAQIAEYIPGVSVPAALVKNWADGYIDEMQRQITGLEARLQASLRDPTKAPPDRSDWIWALALATAAGGSNVFAFRSGQKAKGATA